jgi:ribosome-associated toxin RatA of RatAB toxin-antitoxin module
MRSSIGVEVSASPARVFELARDVSRWPQLLPHYRRVSVERRANGRILARMLAVRPGPLPVPLLWRAEQWAETTDPDDLRLRFRHVRGVTRGMDVTWHIRPAPGGCSVTIEHDFRRPVPLLGAEVLPAILDRVFVRPVAGQTLRTFKALAESGVR